MKPPRRPVHRRDLFKGFRSKAERPAAPASLSDERAAADPGALLKASRPGMGSFFEVRLPVRTPGALELADRMLDRIDVLERQMTVYRDDSELSRINATAYEGPVAVEPALFGLLARAFEIGRETGGAYDIAVGALSAAWGFTRGPKRVPDPEALADARSRSGQRLVRLDPQGLTAAFDVPGVVLNLGSIGKGYAIDQAVELVRKHWWPTSALVHGGQSSVFALGSPPDRFGGRWEVALRNPFQNDEPLGILNLRNQAIGTSGFWYQGFEVNGRLYGHILDPRSGEPPADGPASVTVVAPDAERADALSTAFFLMGAEAAARYCRLHPEVGVLFVVRGRRDGALRLEVLNLDPALFSANPLYDVSWN